MNKQNTQNTLWNIQKLIFLIVFNVVFFVVGGIDHKASVWISYGFIHFAYCMLLLTPRLIRAGKSEAVFGFSLYAISATYFLVEFFIGIFFILISLNGYKAALLVQLCIAGLYGIALISNMLANEYTADSEEKRHSEIEYVKSASAKLKRLLESLEDIDNKEAKKKVERAYDAIYSSPVKSHPSLAQIEDRILKSIRILEDAVSTKNSGSIMALASSLEATINERNSLLKTCN